MKRWWLPTQKGTELFPEVTRSPTKLVIRGVPTGTPLYRAVAQAFGGRLKQFHGKQQHAYSLNDAEVQRGRIDWGDARAVYTNIKGQETLELEVDKAILEKLGPPEKPPPWKWARVDFGFPIIPRLAGAYVYAKLKPDGVKRSLQQSGSYPFPPQPAPFDVLAFAGTDEAVYAPRLNPDQDEIIFSLLLDLRTDFEHPSALISDVYAAAQKTEDVLIGYYLVKTSRDALRWTLPSSETINDLKNDWDAAGLPHSFMYATGIPFGDPQSDQGDNVPGPYGIPPGPFSILIDPTPPGSTGTIGDGDAWRYTAMTFDSHGLIATYTTTVLRWNQAAQDHADGIPNPDTGVISLGAEILTYHYAIDHEIFSTHLIPATGPGSINGIALKEDFVWAAQRWDAPFDASSFESYKWLPDNTIGPEWLALHPVAGDATVVWPNALPAAQPDDADLYLGELIVDRDNGAIIFNSAR